MYRLAKTYRVDFLLSLYFRELIEEPREPKRWNTLAHQRTPQTHQTINQ